MSLILAVGGTGQHVALAIARLAFLKALPGNIECRVIDADRDSALSRRLRTFGGFVDRATGREHPLKGTESFILPYDNVALDDGRRFGDLLVGRTPRPQDDAVVEALFDADDLAREIDNGFFGRPYLGATAFGAQGDGLSRELSALVKNDAFITGSFIGGTGAGVIPRLVLQLQERKPENAEWYGAFLLRWLSQQGGDVGSVSDAALDRNMRHGLEYYYRSVVPALTASALIGPPRARVDLTEPAVPAREMDESPSLYPLVAARYYFARSRESGRDRGLSRVVAYNHANQQPRGLLEAVWAGEVSLANRLKAASRAVELLDHATRSVVARLSSEMGPWGSRLAVPRALHTVRAWATYAKRPVPLFAQELLTDLRARQSALRQCRTYFEAIFGNLDEAGLSEGPHAELRRLWATPVAAPDGARPQNKPAGADAGELGAILVDTLLSELWK